MRRKRTSLMNRPLKKNSTTTCIAIVKYPINKSKRKNVKRVKGRILMRTMLRDTVQNLSLL